MVLAYEDDVNLIDADIRTVKRNADMLLKACKNIDLAINIRKTTYMEVGCLRDLTKNEHRQQFL